MNTRLVVPAVIAALVAAASCGGHSGRTNINQVPAGRSLSIPGMDGEVSVVRDERDQAHVYATTFADAIRVLGYLHAEDRFIQMDLARRLGEGRLGELVGAVDPGVIDADRRFRTLGVARAAQLSLDAGTPKELALMQAYTDGVNAWLGTLSSTFPSPEYAVFNYPPSQIPPWTPLDSAVIGKMFAYELDWDGDVDLVLGNAKAAIDATWPTGPRAGTSDDVLFPFLPPETVSIVNPTVSAAASLPPLRPHIRASALPRASMAGAVASSARVRASLDRWDPFVKGGGIFRDRGSNNWVVAPARTKNGHALICNDPHLSLEAPSVWYPVHLNTSRAGGTIDVEGVSIAGDPAVVIGGNGHVGWAFTNTNPDITDVYVEKYSIGTGAGGADQVMFGTAGLVDLVPLDEVIQMRTVQGTLTTSHLIVWQVPHRQPGGVIVPDSLVVATSGLSTALSWRWGALQATDELGASLALASAQTAADVRAAADHWGAPVQNWVYADDQGSIGYVANGFIPTRSDDDGDLHTDPPQMPVAGFDGLHEWNGTLTRQQVPQENDPARGWIATANQDPIGNTFDGDPYNDTIFLNAIENDLGFRAARISRVLNAAAPGTLTIPDMQKLQADDRSNFGARMLPFLLQSLGSAHPAEAALLTGWQTRGFHTPAAVGTGIAPDDLDDSAATSLFNVWMHFMQSRMLADEFAAAGQTQYDDQLLGRLTLFLLEHPQEAATYDAATGESALWDDVSTVPVESRDDIFNAAFDDALAWLASTDGFSSTDPADWRWGEKHKLIISRQSGLPGLDIPPTGDGFPRHSDMFAVDVGNGGWDDLDFHYGDGPSMRLVMELAPGRFRMFNVIPGGVSGDPTSDYYSDQAQDWVKNIAREVWYREQDVAGHGRVRDLFH